MPRFLEFFDLRGGVGDTFAWVFVHGLGMQGDIGARPGVLRWREVVGIGLTRHFKDGDSKFLRQLGLARKPLGICP